MFGSAADNWIGLGISGLLAMISWSSSSAPKSSDMSGAGLFQLIALSCRPRRDGPAARALHGRGLWRWVRRQRARRPVLPAGREGDLSGSACEPEAGAALEHLRRLAARVQRRLVPRPVRLQRVQGAPWSTRRTCPTSPSSALERRGQLHDQHELAVIGPESPWATIQMLGLAVQNFVSAAAGMSVVVAIIRGGAGRPAHPRQLLGGPDPDDAAHLLPLSFVVDLVPRGAWSRTSSLHDAKPLDDAVAAEVTQPIPAVPSQPERDKQLGTNGGGFYNTNSAHPFENRPGSPTSSRSGPSWSSHSRSSSPTASWSARRSRPGCCSP